MSLEPVILNELQLKSAATQAKIDTQTQTLIADNATKRDEINAHASAAAVQTITDINSQTATKLAEQTTTLQLHIADSEATATQHVTSKADRVINSNTATIAASRDEVNSATQTAKNEVKSHVTSEANRVIAANQSGGSSIVRISRFTTVVSNIGSLTLPSHTMSKRSVNITSLWANSGGTTQISAILISVASTTKLSVSISGYTPNSITFEVIDYA
ncbi:hypothetical protein [Vibrio metschnikovii]|uniref:hypothetical protein n=1 Tax=Vibrio metschnikovii TaxID=28172 RepID=UPI002FCB0504